MAKNQNFKINNGKFPHDNGRRASYPYRHQRYGHPVGSVGYFAHRLHMRPSTLINIFERAGIWNISPNSIVLQSQWQTLQKFLETIRKTKAEELYKGENASSEQIILLQDINLSLLQELERRPQLMYELEPRRFEELVARILEDQGCIVSLTKRTRDGGYDLLGRMKSGPSDLVFLAECKRYSPENKVGVEVVRGLYGVTEIQKANLGLVITTSSFTKDAQEEKLRIGPRIDLKEYSDLCNWLSIYKADS